MEDLLCLYRTKENKLNVRVRSGKIQETQGRKRQRKDVLTHRVTGSKDGGGRGAILSF